MRRWFASELETVATFWRVIRRDGVTIGLTSHDRDLWFDGVLHLASPGMVPSSIKRTADFEPDSAEVEGALSHETITATDLAEGRFDGARIRIGVVDWETGESTALYSGTLGSVVEEDARFSADLASRKAELLRDPVPRTSPTCRAIFAGPGCDLDPQRFTHPAQLVSVDLETNAIELDMAIASDRLVGGWVRWLDGPQTGTVMGVAAVEESRLVLDIPLSETTSSGAALIVREGCDHTVATCSARFANATNFRGEPFLPGNDRLGQYPSPSQ